MSNTNFITDIQSGKTCFTSGGRCNTRDTIYAAECTKHKLIYVGHSSQKLSSRFNGHRSDINVKPKSCELAQHFHGNEESNINRDLKVYMLQDNVTGPRDRREYFEDRWIKRLDTKAPHGMNTSAPTSLQSSRLAQGKGSNPLKVLIKENKSDLSNV